MTIPVMMIYPSVLLQKTFFQFAEAERKAKIGEDFTRATVSAHLSIRVAALAHAALQLLYATVAVIPVTVATIVTVILTPCPTGFFNRSGTVLERVVLAVAAALFSLCAPIAGSFAAMVDIRLLSQVRSCAVSLPIMAQGLLLAFTLPSLADLSKHYACLQSMQNKFGQTTTWYQRWQRAGLLYIADTAPIRSLLQATDQAAFRWRLAFPKALLSQASESISNYDRLFDITEVPFVDALRMAASRATVPDEANVLD